MTLDISKCYDSINANILLEWFKDSSLIDDTYLLNRYVLLQRNKRPLMSEPADKKQKKVSYYMNFKERVCAIPLLDTEALRTGYQERIKDPRPFIILNQAKSKVINKMVIEDQIRHITQHNIIQFQNHYFLQKYGIPQGLNISSVLCSFYFSKIEEEHLSFLKRSESLDLLMRFTDDYVLITSSRDTAHKVLSKLNEAAQQYNFRLNPDKIKSNFDIDFARCRMDTEKIPPKLLGEPESGE